MDAHFRHRRFVRCPCRCRGLGRPRREKVDAQWWSQTNKHVTCQFMIKGRWHETLCFFVATANESISSSRDEMLYIPGDSRRVDAIVLVGQHHSLSDASRATIEKSEMKLGHNDYVLLNLWIFRTSSRSDWQLGGN